MSEIAGIIVPCSQMFNSILALGYLRLRAGAALSLETLETRVSSLACGGSAGGSAIR